MRAVLIVLAAVAVSSGLSGCISVTAPVRERVVAGEWIPGHWVEGENGRRWVEGHYRPVRPPGAPDARP